MYEQALATLRQMLHAAARVLGCGSAQLALVDPTEHSLVIRIAVSNRDVERLAKVESMLGFSTEGAAIPLTVPNSMLVRCVQEGRIFITQRFGDLAAELVPDELSQRIHSLIGKHSFAVVPILGRARAIGVIIFQKPGSDGFSPTDRDLLVAYADRVGAEIESHALAEEVEALSLPGAVTTPPAIYHCRLFHEPTVDGPMDTLRVVEGPSAGENLAQVLGASGAMLQLGAAAQRVLAGEHVITLIPEGINNFRITIAGRDKSLDLTVVCESLAWQDHLQRAMDRARENLTKALSTLDDAILKLDREGRIIDCNLAARRLFAGSASDLCGHNLHEFLHDERSRHRAALIGQRIEQDGYAEAELKFKGENKILPTRVSVLALADQADRFTGAIYRIRDLSEKHRGDAERRRLRARLLRSERLSALGEMAARIAHEVRNPLVSIGATARLIEEELPPASTALEDARAISREVKRLDGILSDFLRFARPRPVERRPMEVDRLLEETLELMRAKSGGITFAIAIDAPRPVMAHCDGDAIRQVLWNLLLNAVEASAAGSTVACAIKRQPGHVEITVSDAGSGLSRDAKRRAFDPFFSTKARGTGLGLAVSKQIVDEHEGKIRLLSRSPTGTQVVVELPC